MENSEQKRNKGVLSFICLVEVHQSSNGDQDERQGRLGLGAVVGVGRNGGGRGGSLGAGRRGCNLLAQARDSYNIRAEGHSDLLLVAEVVELEPVVVVRWVVLDDDEDVVDEDEVLVDEEEEEEVVAVEDEAAADELVLETAVETAVEALAEAEPVPVRANSLL